MTRYDRNQLCRVIHALHGYCKREWDKSQNRWVCVQCNVEADLEAEIQKLRGAYQYPDVSGLAEGIITLLEEYDNRPDTE